MRTGKWVGVALMLAAGLLLQPATQAAADVASDVAGAILVFPKIVTNTATGVDTLIQVSNTSTAPVTLHCFYENANSHCSASRVVCDSEIGACPLNHEFCLPGWDETDFRVILTARQPLAWVASTGLSTAQLPLTSINRAPNGQSNSGTLVPPVSAEKLNDDPDPPLAFVGELKCIVIDEHGRGIARNVIKGEATIVRHPGAGPIDVDKYSALGIQAVGGDLNGDGILELGGSAGEYNGCSNVVIMDHFFDFATNPVSKSDVFSELTFVPCQQDLRNQVPGGGTVQYLIFNEFEQRFSTSSPFQCYFDHHLSRIDTRNAERSIFSVFVAGTLTGQTRIRGVGTGLLAIARENNRGPNRTAAFNLHMSGERSIADQIVLP